MSNNTNAVNLLVAAAEKYAEGLDDLAKLLVTDQIRVAAQALNEVINLNMSLAHQVTQLQNELTESYQAYERLTDERPAQETLVFEEVN